MTGGQPSCLDTVLNRHDRQPTSVLRPSESPNCAGTGHSLGTRMASGCASVVTTPLSVASRMSAQATRDTEIEIRLRSSLHRRGLRFTVHRRPERNLRATADILFRPARVAVFVDGCFWHGCPRHASWPKTNAAWWRDKIRGNRSRDARVTRLLRSAGWSVVHVWEHENAERASHRIERIVRARS
jgi:DNA mismatch endonuclease, patch repair protein